MSSTISSGKRTFIVAVLAALGAVEIQSCSSGSGGGESVDGGSGGGAIPGGSSGGVSAGSGVGPVGGRAATPQAGTAAASGRGAGANGGSAVSGSSSGRAGSSASVSGGSAGRGAAGSSGGGVGATGGGGRSAGGITGSSAGASGASGGSTSTNGNLVAMVQSTKAQASEITPEDIKSMVTEAVTLAGGLDFIQDGNTVVLKPNLLVTTVGSTQLSPTVNGITTDWRVVRALAELVRAKNPTGKILVMEGSTESTTQAFTRMGYTTANFGTSVDEFIALEGASCTAPSVTGLVEKEGPGGKRFWVNERYFNADVVISVGALKTHAQAGVTGAVKNLGVGATPANKYATRGCSRNQTAQYIDHGRAGLGQFIHDYYSVRPADFALLDGLQGIQHGPSPNWVPGGNYETDRMNMRLILAAKNAVALDMIEALVMGCDPKNVDHLTKLAASGLGPADASSIQVVGKQVNEVKKEFAGPDWACGAP